MWCEASPLVVSASSRKSSKAYHDSTTAIADAIEVAIAGACDGLEIEEWEKLECARAAVRKVRKNQIETQVRIKDQDDDAASVDSAASGSTWKSSSQVSKSKEAENLVPATAKTNAKPIRVYVDGCFDIMHSGHYNMLRQAKQLGDVLIAGVHSSAEIQRSKGPPVMTDDERCKIVKACKWVDEVAFDMPYQPSVATLDSVNADFCVHGDDLPVGADGGPHAYYEVQQAGRLRLCKRTEGVSTTDLVGRLLLATSEHLQQRSAPSPDSPASMIGPPNASGGTNGKELRAIDEDAKSSAEGGEGGHYARIIGSNFLPTSWRIAQFSNSRAPTAEDIVVYIDGSWDLFHVGHVDILEAAAKLGTFLLVGVHDDQSVNKNLGKNYPIMNLHERVLNVLSCVHVDDVIIGAPWVVSEDMLTTFNVQKVVAVADLLEDKLETGKGLAADPYALPKSKGIFSKIEDSQFFTADKLVDRIIDNREKYVNRNKGREKKEADYLQNAKVFVAETNRGDPQFKVEA